MSDDTTNPTAPETAPQAAPQAAPASGPWVDPSLLAEAEVEKLRAEAADFKDRWMRAAAETENLRRRAERDVADARTYAVTSFARDLLDVADNLRRAVETIPPDLAASELAPLVEGVSLTEANLLKVFDKFKIARIEPVGEKFDPNRHQAMFEVPTNDVPKGTVVQVIQAGFVIGDRPLRPALVGVAKPAPGAAAPAADPAG